MLLKDKKILVGITGSISIYKSLELIRVFIKAGAEVKVVMSESAKRFITPLTFEAISQNEVLHEGSESWSSELNHIGVARWADIYVIAPSTANTINKLSKGVADTLVTQVALASGTKKIIAPSANTNMYKNHFTDHSIKFLKLNNYIIVPTQSKSLACNEVGDGALAHEREIFYFTARELLREEFWSDRRVVVSGGGTIEKIDDIRFISNFSSGKMAKELATALYLRGADVCLISTKSFENLPKEIYFLEVESSEEMSEYLVDSIRVAKKGVLTKATLMDSSNPTLIQKKPYLFMAAAVSDFVPKFRQDGKIKKEMMGENWNLEMKKNSDILKSLGKNGIITVGFKAEMDRDKAFENAKRMLKDKELDAVCLNIISKENNFGSNNYEIDIITKNKNSSLGRDSKLNRSFKILKSVKEIESE